jgi:uncharacterized protein YaaR (DUF327 family)
MFFTGNTLLNVFIFVKGGRKMKHFKPVNYLRESERKQAVNYESLLSSSTNLKDVQRYERLLKRYVKLAYMRMKTDEIKASANKEPEEEEEEERKVGSVY